MEKDILNETIESLHKVLEAKDNIINEQVLEIARLKEQQDKAIEYIKKAFPTDFCEMEYEGAIKLLEILGDKENE